MSQVKADLITLVKVDSKGRIVIDSHFRDVAEIGEGDLLRMALVKEGKSWLISLTEAKAK